MNSKLYPRAGWVKPIPEDPQTSEGMAEKMQMLKEACAEYEEIVQRYVRVLNAWKRDFVSLRNKNIKKIRQFKIVKG